MENNFNPDSEQRALIARLREGAQASISINKQDRPQSVYRFEVDLSVERGQYDPFNINFPFRSIFVESCTDPASRVNIKPTTNDEHQNYFSLGYKDSWSTSEIIPKAFLHWPAQVGKMTLVVFTDAEFRSGSQVSLNAGGVSISEGSSLTQPAPITLVAATPAQVLPQNLFRKVGTVVNKTGADIWVGGPTVSNTGATEGFNIKSGESINWRNTAALYAYSLAGGKIVLLEQT